LPATTHPRRDIGRLPRPPAGEFNTAPKTE